MIRVYSLIFILSLSVLCACAPESTEFSDFVNVDKPGGTDKPDDGSGQKPEDEYTPTEADKRINQELFSVINLDYPGLETVKAEYQKKHYAAAADALLKYYRERTLVNNVEVDLANTTMYPEEMSVANQALEHRFCVKSANFYESVSGSSYTYWDFDDASGKINWAFEPAGAGSEFYQKHWHQWFNYLARAYNSTKEEKYFDSWKEVYADWLANFPCPTSISAYGNKSWHQLSVATRISNQVNLLPYFLSSTHFTGDWLATVLVEFCEAVEFSRKNPYYDGTSNIRFAQQTALAKAAILMPEFVKAPEWLAEAGRDISSQLTTQFYSDGIHIELTPSYQLGVMENFRVVYNTALANERLGAFSSDYVKCLRNACIFMASYVWPNYTWECFNDTFRQTRNVLLRNIRNYYAMFPDEPVLKYLGSDRKEGSAPAQTLSSFPEGGYYMLRNGWDESSTMMILKNNYNPVNKWHCQMDNGTVALWSKGRNFLPDAGVYTYGGTAELDAKRTSYQATSNHNTLTKGLSTIAAGYSKGVCRLAKSQNDVDVVVTENASYSDLTHRRAVFMVNRKFYVIVDEAYGAAADAEINLSFHLCNGTVAVDDYSSSYSYGLHTEFADRNDMLFRTFSETETGYRPENGTSTYSETLNTEVSRKFYRVNVRKSRASDAVRFITVVYPARSAEISAIFASEFRQNASSVKVTVDGTSYDLSYSY